MVENEVEHTQGTRKEQPFSWTLIGHSDWHIVLGIRFNQYELSMIATISSEHPCSACYMSKLKPSPGEQGNRQYVLEKDMRLRERVPSRAEGRQHQWAPHAQ